MVMMMMMRRRRRRRRRRMMTQPSKADAAPSAATKEVMRIR